MAEPKRLYDIVPDMSTFGKAMANGFSVPALAANANSWSAEAFDTTTNAFSCCTTHGGETHALAAAVATMRTFAEEPVVATLESRGTQLANGLRQAIGRHQLEGYVEIIGRPSCLVYATRDTGGKPSQSYRALFLQAMIQRGVIGTSLVVSYSHTEEDIDRTVEAIDGALGVYSRALNDGVDRYLTGHPCKPVFRKYA